MNIFELILLVAAGLFMLMAFVFGVLLSLEKQFGDFVKKAHKVISFSALIIVTLTFLYLDLPGF